MRNNYFISKWNKIYIVWLIITFIGCKPSHKIQNNAEASIRRIIAQYNESWVRHDSEMRHNLFSDDADITNVVGKTVHGRAGMTENAKDPLYQIMNGNAIQKIDSISIRFLQPKIAAVDGRWSMIGGRHPDGSPWPDRRGLINMIITKEHGTWLIKIFHNAEFPERPKILK